MTNTTGTIEMVDIIDASVGITVDFASESEPKKEPPPFERLGELCETWDDYGDVQKVVQANGREIFFAWPHGEGRGFFCMSLPAARVRLGVKPRTGFTDLHNTVKRGRCIERSPNGEIWKETDRLSATYFVWFIDRPHSAQPAFSLIDARRQLGIDSVIKQDLIAQAKAKAKSAKR